MTDEINEEAVVDNAVGSRSDITPVDVSEEMRRSYLDYAMSGHYGARPAGRARRLKAGASPDHLFDVRKRL